MLHRLAFWLLFCGSLYGCQTGAQPPPQPATPADGAVSVLRQVETLGPELLTVLQKSHEQGRPLMRFYTAAPVPTENTASEEARIQRLVQQQPDVANELAATLQELLQPALGAKPDPQALMRVLRRHPNSDLAWYLLAGLQVHQRNEAAALASLNKAIALNGQVGAYYRQRAMLRGWDKQPQQALPDLQRALHLYTAKRRIAEELANLHAELGNEQAFVRIWDKLIADDRRALNRLQQQHPLNNLRLDSLRQELSGAYLAKAMHFIYQGDTAKGCPELRQAVAIGLEDANEMMGEYCR